MSRKELEAKKRHHYVWANYLARWGRGTKNVFYTTKTGKIAHDSVRAIVAEDYLYKTSALTKIHVDVIKGFSRLSPDHLHQQHMSYLDNFLMLQKAEEVYLGSGIRDHELDQRLHALKCNLVEDLHATHEEEALPVLSALANEELNVLEDKQRMIEFMTFFGHQISRTKTFRDAVVRRQQQRNAMEATVVDAMEHAWWFLSYMFGMSLGWSLYASRKNARHALLINDSKVPFITSDQPIVNVHPCVSETGLVAPEHADFHYPISPRIAYMICDSKRFRPGKNEVDESTVVEFNTKLAAQSLVHIIGDTESAIRPFQKYIGRRHLKAPTPC